MYGTGPRAAGLHQTGAIRPSSISGYPGGKLLIGGTWRTLRGKAPGQNANAVVVRIRSNGRLDKGFGRNGRRLVGFGRVRERDHTVEVGFDQRGQVVVGSTTEGRLAIARLERDGGIGTTFSGESYARIGFDDGGAVLTALPSGEDGQIVAGGTTQAGRAALARFRRQPRTRIVAVDYCKVDRGARVLLETKNAPEAILVQKNNRRTMNRIERNEFALLFAKNRKTKRALVKLHVEGPHGAINQGRRILLESC